MEPRIAERLERCASLPSVPVVAARVLELCRSPEPDLDEIARALAADPALCAKLLRTVNSPMFALRGEVKTVRHALAMLGLISVRTLALSFSLAQGLRKNQKRGFKTYWKRSALAAVAAKELARTLLRPDAEELFLAALLQDIGVLALGQISTKSFESLDGRKDDHAAVIAHERAEFGCDHAAAGAWLAKRWGFPAPFVLAIEHSHDLNALPPGTPPELRPIIAIVAASGLMADIWIAPDADRATRAAQAVVGAELGLAPSAFQNVLERMRANAEEISRFLDVDLGSRAELTSILDQAKETLVLISLHAQQAVGSLEAKTRELVEEAQRDPLTGVGNRGYLDRSLEHEVASARAAGRPLSVVMVDIDHFKRVNDELGHPSGDRVLKAVAELLRRSIRPRDAAARYGGEEFALILPDTPLEGAAIVAERIRGRIEAKEIPVAEGRTARATASFGCATIEPGEAITAAELVGRADRALYAAKRGGRNRVVMSAEAPAPAAKAG